MAPIGILYGPAGHPLAKRPRAVAAYAGVELDMPAFAHGTDNKTAEYLRKFPGGKIPAFEGPDGFLLTETTAISKYIAAKSSKPAELLGSTIEEQALVDQWLSFSHIEVHQTALTTGVLVMGVVPYTEAAYTQAIETNHAALFAAEQHLASRTFLITEHITVADIYLANAVKMCISYTMGQEERARYPSVIRHFERIYNIPEIKGVFGKAEYLDKPPVFTPKKDKPVAN